MKEKVLVHYGIKGTKWGVKNGPPYPLPYEAHTAAEKKANPKTKLDNYGTGKPVYNKNSRGSKAARTAAMKRFSGANRNEAVARTGKNAVGAGYSDPSYRQSEPKDSSIVKKNKDSNKIPFKLVDDGKVYDIYNSSRGEYLRLSQAEKEQLASELGVNNVADYARYKLKEYLKDPYYALSDDDISEKIKELEEKIQNEITEGVSKEYSKWLEEFTTLDDDFKENMNSNLDGSQLTNAQEYADEMARLFISENYGYSDEDADTLLKQLKKNLSHSGIGMNKMYDDEHVLVHHGILGMRWGIRRFQNKDGTLTAAGKRRYDTDGYVNNNSSSSEHRSDMSQVRRSSNVKEATAKSKTMTNDELRKSAERLELENRYIRAVQSQQGKTFMENVASKANTVASLMNSTNSITQFVTGKNFAQLISKGSENLLDKKVKDLELENKYYNEIAKKNRRTKNPGDYIDWDSVIDEWTEKFK